MENSPLGARLYRNLPNLITVLRVIGTAAILFVPALDKTFYILYTLSGLSDAVDGWLARKLNLSSPFGAKLDSAADLMFYFAMFIRIFPVLWDRLPRIIWLGVALVVFLRLLSYTVAAIKFRRFASMHTIMNKLTGVAVFTLPYILQTSILTAYCWGLFILSGCSTAEELVLHIRSKEYAGANQ